MSATTIPQTSTRRPLLVIGALVLIAILVGLWGMRLWRGGFVTFTREPVSQQLGTATQAEVEIGMGVGQLRIGALDEPGALVVGQISYPEHNRVERSFTLDGDTARFSLREYDSQARSLVKSNYGDAVWDLRLAPATPLRLTLETGVGEGKFDLSRLHVTDLTLKAGVGSIALTLPNEGHVQAQVSGGIGETTIRVPKGVAMRVMADVGIGGIQIPDGLVKRGGAYVSPDYETATNRVDLAVESGIGAITIVQASE
jgi:hypothetical protein